jgi:indole-3-glycerol phosphate synthase
VHDEEELAGVLEVEGVSLIGVNNRDLKTFEVDLDHTRKLIEKMPEGVTVVSESGIYSPDDIRWLTSIGADAVLVGEHFMRQEDVAEAVRRLMGDPQANAAGEGRF